MFKNYGDWDFFEDGILVEQQSPSQFTLLRCNPVQDQEDRYESPGWMWIWMMAGWINRPCGIMPVWNRAWIMMLKWL